MILGIFIGLAALSLVVVVIIIVRNYHKLLFLDVDTLPYTHEERKKEEFMRKKAAEKAAQKNSRVFLFIKKSAAPISSVALGMRARFRRFFASIQRKATMHDAKGTHLKTPEDKVRHETLVKQLMFEAHRDFEQEDYDTAEKRYLAVLRQDPKNIEAYKGLAKVYQQQGQLLEAKETYQFVLQIDPTDEEAYLKLGDMYEEEGRLEKAVEYYEQAVLINPHNPLRFAKLHDLLFELKQYETALEAISQALEIEPQNPKYLDNFTEVSILLKRKELAEKGYRELRMINPENQKLRSFRQRIDELS